MVGRKQNSPLIEFFTNSSQYNNANVANLVLALPLEMNYRPVKYETLKLNPIIYTDV